MHRKALKFSAAALIALGFGCGDMQKERPGEREAGEPGTQRTAPADQPPGAADPQGDDRSPNQDIVGRQQQQPGGTAPADVPSERFEAYKPGETPAAFASRAQSALEEITAEVSKMEMNVPNVPADKQKDVVQELADAREASAEARKDLAEIQSGDAGTIDDGKIGVTVAINRARRSLEDAREQVGGTQAAPQ